MSAEMFVIVELIDGLTADTGFGIIRTYLTKQRAEEDIELLRQNCLGRRFDIMNVPHIDS